MQEKVIPQSIEAEQNVLSALLIDTKAIDKAARLLKPDDFYRPDHRIIYSAMLALHDKNRPVDMLTVTEELKKRNQLDDVGSIINRIKSLGIQIFEVDIDRGGEDRFRHPSAVFTIRLQKKQPHTMVLTAISELETVYTIEEI